MRYYVLHFPRVPDNLQRGLRMVATKRGCSLRECVLSMLYAAVNAEMSEIAGTTWWRPIDEQTWMLRKRPGRKPQVDDEPEIDSV